MLETLFPFSRFLIDSCIGNHAEGYWNRRIVECNNSCRIMKLYNSTCKKVLMSWDMDFKFIMFFG